MLPYDAIVRVVQLTDFEYDDREYNRLGTILLCDYRGRVAIPDVTHTLAVFTFPRWFDNDTSATDGLTYLWVKNEDLEVVSLDFCKIVLPVSKFWVRQIT